jgi:hypothetical protein
MIEGLGEALPLVDQDRPLTLEKSRRVGLGDGALGVVVKAIDRRCASQGCGGLSDGLWALKRDRG